MLEVFWHDVNAEWSARSFPVGGRVRCELDGRHRVELSRGVARSLDDEDVVQRTRRYLISHSVIMH